jgi:HAD superfamily hydrolase (TIGR01509 family)
MVEAVRRARAAGVRTALVSNSWGNDYPRHEWDGLFHAVVISGEVGMRKPEPGIYLHAANLLGVETPQCVFVDDLGPNVRGATAVGMVGVHHVTPTQTLAELEALFGVALT